MGCASSNPLVEGGKNLLDNAKETTDNVIAKGEKVMHDAGDAVTSGVDHVKHTIETGIATAQSSIGNVVNNIENTIGTAKSNATEAVESVDNAVEDLTDKSNEMMEEAISDTKTVLAFEGATNQVADKMDDAKHEFGETVTQIEAAVEETLQIEDIEQHMENLAAESSDHMERMMSEAPSPPGDAPVDEPKEQEPALTPWERAADRILENRLKSYSLAVAAQHIYENNKDNERALLKTDSFEKDYGENANDIRLSDTISIKSYKSEI